jgi:hypothetical protein
MFSKSQNSARLRSPLTTAGSCSAGIGHPHVDASILGDRRITVFLLPERILPPSYCIYEARAFAYQAGARVRGIARPRQRLVGSVNIFCRFIELADT